MFYKFIFFVKNLFHSKKEVLEDNAEINYINWDLINQISENDIVWVKMNKEEIEKAKIREGHQNRPFLITTKNTNENKVSGYYLSSNVTSNYALHTLHNSRLILEKDKYNLKKDSILMCNKEIDLPYENIEKKLDSLNLTDLRKLKLYIKNLEIENKDKLEKTDIKYLNVGKIISLSNRYYLVYQQEKKDIYCFNIKKDKIDFKELSKEERLNYFKYNKNYYKVNYEERLHINENSSLEVKIIDSITPNDVDKILKNRTQIKYNKKKIKRDKKKQKRR